MSITAHSVLNRLNGIICVYKPKFVTTKHMRAIFLDKICQELNRLPCPEPQILKFSDNLSVSIENNLAYSEYVSGPRFTIDTFKCSWVNYLGSFSNGLQLIGFREGSKYSKYLRDRKLVRTYKVTGCLGKMVIDGRTVERSTWRHVKITHLETLLNIMQASHQKQMFSLSGLDIHSEEAFDVAAKGALRPYIYKVPLIYNLICTEFNRPEFTLEIQCVNEREEYFKTLITEIGLKLHSTAHCTSIQCIRYAGFQISDALLKKHLTLDNILINFEKCNDILEKNFNAHRNTLEMQC